MPTNLTNIVLNGIGENTARPSIYQQIQDARLASVETGKYLLEIDGEQHNAGEFRDNTRDMLEELSDCEVIGQLLLARLEAGDPQDVAVMSAKVWYDMYLATLKATVGYVIKMRQALPPEMQKDLEDIIGPVKRYPEFLT